MRQFFTFFLMATSIICTAQPKPLIYYLPEIEYDQEITTPEEFLGYQIGEWHISHDQLLHYMRTLARESDRISITEYAKSHEQRPLVYLTITESKNHKKLSNIRMRHLALTDPSISKSIDLKDMPLILYQGYSIHGNEASGSNAAMLMAYYLAAGNSKRVKKLLKESVTLLDPCYNPDGLNRFASWVNSHRSKHLNPDENDREFKEAWPKGRTNHYWFDLNRDWLLLVHPESRGRIKVFHQWMPNILTDHHEMGKNSTFFFQPGVPSRTNPNTPQLNQKITEDISKFHSRALDEIGSEYFSKKRFDDFYYGKGSTYPDACGSIGILFEQASARGHLQETKNEDLSFPFAIRNQVVTSLSTQAAALNYRKELLTYQRNFFLKGIEKAKENPIKGYIYTDNNPETLKHFNLLLQQHRVVVSRPNEDLTIGDKKYSKSNSFVVPLAQKNYILAKTFFEKVNAFRDSIFYDVSAWTMPMAYNFQYDALDANELNELKALPILYTDQLASNKKKRPKAPTDNSSIYTKLYNNLNDSLVTAISIKNNQAVLIDSSSKLLIKKPKIAMLVGDEVTATAAGELWHFLDHRNKIPVTKIPLSRFISSSLLDKYNTLILASGFYNGLEEETLNEISAWIENGGHLICLQDANRWLSTTGWIDLTFKKRKSLNAKTNKFIERSTNVSRGPNVIGGAIMKNEMQLNHPFSFGYSRSEYYSFKKGTHFVAEPKNDETKVFLRYAPQAKASGYVSKVNEELINASPALLYQKKGQGQVTSIIDSPIFRGYWQGGFKLMLNTIFFAELIQ